MRLIGYLPSHIQCALMESLLSILWYILPKQSLATESQQGVNAGLPLRFWVAEYIQQVGGESNT